MTGLNEDMRLNQQSGNPIKPSSAGLFARPFLCVFNILLYTVFKLVMVILIIAANIFDWAVNSENFRLVMEMQAIREGWRMIRDFLNIFFILVLLFSAFCTIFQVAKYHLKKIILTLVIMALLVNFSFPIARFIIDAGNVPMYYFFQQIASVAGGGSGSSISQALVQPSGSIETESGLQAFMLPKIGGYGDITGTEVLTFRLLAAIIFVFLFAITLLVMAVLLVIRILVLAILIIFAPVGFVASIFPGFSKYADDWWTTLFKQSFSGTVMAFMILISIYIMKEAQLGVMKSLKENVTKNTIGGDFSQVIVAGVTLAIPIVLLWIGIISAQKIGAMGAEQASKIGKWGGKLPWRGTKSLANATGIPGGIKQKYENVRSGLKSKLAQREARIAGSGPFAVKGAKLQDINKRSEEYKKNHVSEDELKSKAKGGDIAAAHRLAADGNMDLDTYSTVMSNPEVKGDKKIEDMLNGKVKEKRVDVIVDYRMKTETDERARVLAGSSPVTEMHKHKARIEIAEEEIGKISPSKWKDQKVDDLLGYDDATKAFKNDANSRARRFATKAVFNSQSSKNREKVVDDMEPGKYARGKKAKVWA